MANCSSDVNIDGSCCGGGGDGDGGVGEGIPGSVNTTSEVKGSDMFSKGELLHKIHIII